MGNHERFWAAWSCLCFRRLFLMAVWSKGASVAGIKKKSSWHFSCLSEWLSVVPHPSVGWGGPWPVTHWCGGNEWATWHQPSLPHLRATRSPHLGGVSFQLFRPYYKLFFGHFSRHVLAFSTGFLPTSPHPLPHPLMIPLVFIKSLSIFPFALPVHRRSRIFFLLLLLVQIFKII